MRTAASLFGCHRKGGGRGYHHNRHCSLEKRHGGNYGYLAYVNLEDSCLSLLQVNDVVL